MLPNPYNIFFAKTRKNILHIYERARDPSA